MVNLSCSKKKKKKKNLQSSEIPYTQNACEANIYVHGDCELVYYSYMYIQIHNFTNKSHISCLCKKQKDNK